MLKFVCWCFAISTKSSHNTQQRPFKVFERPTPAKKLSIRIIAFLLPFLPARVSFQVSQAMCQMAL